MKLYSIPPGTLAEHGIDPYENAPRRRRICITVILLHLLLIALPILAGYLILEPEKPLRVIKASLVPPLGDSLDVQPDQIPSAEPAAPADTLPETPVMPELPVPKTSTEPVPDLPPPPPPPEPAKPEVKKPEVKKPEVKKPEVKKPEVKKTEVKKPRKVTAEDILKSRDKDAAKKIEQARKAQTEAARAKALADAQAKAQAAMQARRRAIEQAQNASQKRYGSALGDPNSLTPVGDTSDYEDQLKAWLGRRWREPSDTELNGKRPSVQVTLSIAADGTVTRKDFKPCGVEAMDRSVREMLRDLKAVPKPPAAMTINVTLVVKE